MSLIKKSFILLIAASLAVSSLYASAAKGKKLYQKKLQSVCGKNGGDFAAAHSQHEWKEAMDAGTLNKLMIRECPAGKSFLESPKFEKKYQQHFFDFLYEYANDSGKAPSC
jgi:hypothetical protein